MKILFYDTKQYDRDSFEKTMVNFPEITVDFLKTDISHRTVELAKGYDAVCVFVASDLSGETVKKLGEYGVKLILLRCAGFNNVDLLEAAKQNITVMRVPGYSPEAAPNTLRLTAKVSPDVDRNYPNITGHIGRPMSSI